MNLRSTRRLRPLATGILALVALVGCKSDSQPGTHEEGAPGAEEHAASPAEETEAAHEAHGEEGDAGHEAHDGEDEAAHAAHGEEDEAGQEAHGEEGGAEQVELSAEARRRLGVTIAPVEVGNLRDDISGTAAVEHDITRVAHIAPMVEGQISELKANLGEEVEAGQVLAVMRSVALGEARAAVDEAQAVVNVARQNFRRQKRLEDKGIASERSFIEARGELEQAKARLDGAKSRLDALGITGGTGPTYPLQSHIEGTVIEQHASLGETKGPRDELFVVADQDVVWVIGQVPEQSIHQVEMGLGALVTLDAYPSQTWRGTVDWIASTVDPKTRLLPVRVTLENPDGRLKPGMFGKVHLSPADSERQVPLVPVDAVQQVHGEAAVFVPGDHEGEFRAQPVELGTEADGFIEVISGLSPGARVVTEGAFDLKAALTASGRSAAHQH